MTAREYRKESGPRVYDTQRWRKLSKAKLAKNPFCERHEKKGIVVMAKLVHHRDHDTNNWADENLESLCKQCHEQEHRHEVFRRRESGPGHGGDCKISGKLP